MRLGVLGGTFNPIHLGHLSAADDILDIFKLDKVVFIPSARPPHKEIKKVADPFDRLVMTILATLSHPKWAVSAMELNREGKSYSIETINGLKQEYGEKVDLYFIVGIDAFLEVSTWKKANELLRSCNFIVMSRPGYCLDGLLETLEKTVTTKYNQLKFYPFKSKEFDNLESIQVYQSPYLIFLAPITRLDISSTQIRERIIHGRTIKYLVPPLVEEYIRKKGLYKEEM
ncbi:MAG: nicotinate-nucleotide adenylyltransferase [Candidatus Tectomicrobia bacterium]|uniref:Probable nicotinate-nucleotide adenylyltransferase n=1 Tax=Tectimicrobiota bacterium TaxID=2528274 RepID=A0A933GPE4_UNCTE|nr:nicotinate-nucleotide adenylyltransferase [Candidatus Tectomicrobia bacterium]